MKVQFNPNLTTFNNHKNLHKQEKRENNTANYSYNPVSYRDYGITFGARLFRTPENFYEQDFNKNGMPKTLHKYIYNPLYNDFRKTIPPAQAMQEVFGPIASMQSLEEVKAAYPDEPLFQDLHSKSGRKYRTGLLGELSLLREDEDYKNKSLFKNGKDDLGMYIIKKIYVEGKTLKEINKDFHKDKSVVYTGLSDIQYSDLQAFGIHFPKVDFWKSFIATREDFPYVHIPRKIENRSAAHTQSPRYQTPSIPKQQKNKFDDVKDWEIDKISQALIDGMGDPDKTERQLKKRNVKDPEKLNFVAKYMGEINSVVLEKLHISEDMKEYFGSYYDSSKSQTEKFKDYWKIPDSDNVRSKVMSSTIRLFFDLYGADGNNDDFRELLEYARNIKPNRILKEKEHDRIQAEYDELFANLPFEEEKVVEEPEVQPQKPEKISFEDMLAKEAKSKNAEIYSFILKDGTEVSIVANLKEMLQHKITSENSNLPDSYSQRLVKTILNHPLATDRYLLSCFYNVDNLLDIYNFIPYGDNYTDEEKHEFNKRAVRDIRSQLMTPEEINKITQSIYADFYKNNKKYVNAVIQTMMELAMQLPLPPEEELQRIIKSEYNYMESKGLLPEDVDTDEKSQAFREVKQNVIKGLMELKQNKIASLSLSELQERLYVMGLRELSPGQKRFFDERINRFYGDPLSNKEQIQIVSKITNMLVNESDSRNPVVKAAMEAAKKYPGLKATLADYFNKGFVNPNNTTLRYFLDKNADKRLIDAKISRIITELDDNETNLFEMMASMDKDIMDKYIRPYDLNLYMRMLNHRQMALLYFAMNKDK